MAGRRSNDITSMKFPLQIVILLGGMVASSVATRYTTQSGNDKVQNDIRSDIRNISTQLQGARDVSEVQSKLQEERLNALRTSIDSQASTMKAAIEAVSKKQEYQAIQIQELSEKFSTFSAGRK
jgi:hypothetical protein